MSQRLLPVVSNVIILVLLSFDKSLSGQAKETAAYYEDKIVREIIGKYSSKVRPAVNPRDTINVTLDITFNNIIDLNEKYQILQSSIWVRQMWVNPLVSWNSSEYGDLTSVIVDSKMIWQPDIALYNNINDESSAQLDQRPTRVRVYNSGYTFWASPYIFKTLCKINVENFPFDTQQCMLQFGAWQYDGKEVNIVNKKKIAALAKTRVPSGEWDVLKVEIIRKVVFYACCPDLPYPEISFVIHMKRKPLFFIVNLVLPNILIAFLAFFSFFIPVESGERVSFVITVLLSMTVFMLLIAESIPPTSEAVPMIGIYYTFSIFLVFMALAATAVTLRINYSYMFGEGLSTGSKHLIFKYIGPCLGFDVRKMLGQSSKRRDKRRNRNPSNITYGGCNSCTHCSTPSPTNELDPTNAMMCNGSNYEHSNDKTYAYIADNNQSNHQSEKLMLDVMDNNEPYFKRLGHHDDRDDMETYLTVEEQRVKESKLAATIIDRMFLWVFSSTYGICTAVILCIPLFR